MKRFALVYYDITYRFRGCAVKDFFKLSKREVKEIPESFESKDEVKEWLDELETELAKEFIEKDIDFYNDVNVYIKNIVRL